MTIYSYTKVWKVEKKIYNFSNVTLWVPIEPRELGYFVLAALCVWVLGKIFPVVASLPMVIRLGAIPFGVTRFLTKKKLDGKNPIRYALDGIQFLLIIRGKKYNGFRGEFIAEEEKIKLDWNCSKGTFR